MINDVPKEWRYFIEEVFEITHGDNAINRGFDAGEVLAKLKEHSNHAYEWEKHIGVI